MKKFLTSFVCFFYLFLYLIRSYVNILAFFIKLGSEVTLKQFVLFLQTRHSPHPRYS